MGAEWSTWTTSQLQQAAQQAVERQEFATAVPVFAEMDRRLRESAEPGVRQAREEILFLLGLGQLQGGEPTAAAETLEAYLATFPDGRQVALAQLFLGDAHFFQGAFDQARPHYEALVAAPTRFARLDSPQQLALWERLSDCCAASQDWAGGLRAFAALREAAARQLDPQVAAEKRGKASAYLLQAAIAQGELEKALAALPGLAGEAAGAARYDLALNLALVRCGDALYEQERYAEALYVYQHVVDPDALGRWWEAAENAARLAVERAQTLPTGAQRRAALEHAWTSARARREQVERAFDDTLPDYRHALNFRIARCYLVRDRVHEAYWAFVRLQEEADRTGHADYRDEAVFGQVQTAAGAGNLERVRAQARAYLSSEAIGRYVTEVATEWVRVERAGDNDSAVAEIVRLVAEGLRRQPEHRAAAKLVYFIGSTLVEVGSPELAEQVLAPLLEEPRLEPVQDGVHYWRGMAALFAAEYAGAREHFVWVHEQSPTGAYGQDAEFRIAVCDFGLLAYAEAEQRLQAFVRTHPESRLLSEAHALLGDLAAAEGRVEDALEAYRTAMQAGAALVPPHQSYIDHAAFQAGRLLLANRRWAEAADWFGAYIDRWGVTGRLSEALFEQGKAWTALGRAADAAESWIQAIERYGNDPLDTGIDAMLQEYAAKYQAAHEASPAERLRAGLARAVAAEHHALRLRLTYALAALDEGEPPPPRLERADWPWASVAVLVAEAARVRSADPDEALALASAVLERPGEHPWAETALHLQGELLAQRGEPEAALRAYQNALARFPTSRATASAHLRVGDLLYSRGSYEEAISAYRNVLQSRAWRGAAWAEANYKIGQAHFAAGDYKESFAFCQRVYVLYAHLPEWAAPAYLTSGLALEALGRPADAAATYRELLAQGELAATAAAQAAQRRLEAL